MVPVFVEPLASACFFASLISGRNEAVSIYDYGLDNRTIADRLAVPRASQLVLDLVGCEIDAAVALPDELLPPQVRHAWETRRLRLEPSAAAGIAAVRPFLERLPDGPLFGRNLTAKAVRRGVHVAWTTGGAHLPDTEFNTLLEGTT